MKLQPVGSKLLVRPLLAEEKTAGGIILPETAKEKPQRGEVLAIGSGKLLENGQREEAPAKIGDLVLFTKYGPTEIKVDNEELYILDFSDILAVEQ
jgi:chaperonin GroES